MAIAYSTCPLYIMLCAFWMGSPEEEEGRFEWEGSRHEVRISRGYWLFDTPCTQALWLAVMDDNPSGFQGEDRPVESVSWEDCQRFIERLNAQLPALALRLPTEAQWEYACRAGTETARMREIWTRLRGTRRIVEIRDWVHPGVAFDFLSFRCASSGK